MTYVFQRTRCKALLVLYLLLATCGAAIAQTTQSAPLITGVDAVSMTVADMDRSVAFFVNVLTFEKIADFEAAGDQYE